MERNQFSLCFATYSSFSIDTQNTSPKDVSMFDSLFPLLFVFKSYRHVQCMFDDIHWNLCTFKSAANKICLLGKASNSTHMRIQTRSNVSSISELDGKDTLTDTLFNGNRSCAHYWRYFLCQKNDQIYQPAWKMFASSENGTAINFLHFFRWY